MPFRGQQLIGGLGGRDSVAGGVQRRHRQIPAVQLALLDNVVPGDHGFQVPWNIRCTSEVSAPARRRYAAASQVRPPVRLVKFLVSSTMPASRASASHLRMSPGSTRYRSRCHQPGGRGGVGARDSSGPFFRCKAAAPAVVVDDLHPVVSSPAAARTPRCRGGWYPPPLAGRRAAHFRKASAAGEVRPRYPELLHQPPQDGMGGVNLGVDNDLAACSGLRAMQHMYLPQRLGSPCPYSCDP